ncbi:hypothetical protein DVH24_033173 [Malus domestica]|uniref:Transmembrane 9 superfamily member n=1 Tax=Malus domestica TaxID=3750 RepID=A0A498JBV9_MALDO|nr:hypothetical protein DVH24_033173 [Malus domestica]
MKDALLRVVESSPSGISLPLLCLWERSESSQHKDYTTSSLTVQIPPSPAIAMFSSVRSLSLPLLFVFFLLAPAFAAEADHKYQTEESVTLWVNKVGPYNNPQETYNYYSLPFCHQSENAAHKWGGLGEVLGGNELIDSQIEIKFQSMWTSLLCKMWTGPPFANLNLTIKRLNNSRTQSRITTADKGRTQCTRLTLYAGSGRGECRLALPPFMERLLQVSNPRPTAHGRRHLPSHQQDKNSGNGKHVLYTHKNIIVKYNNDQIIHVNLTQDSPKPLEVGKKLDLTYSVKWIATTVTFARRFDVYLDYPFFEHQIHWFSIFNSFMMVIFLTGLVSMILMRTLRNDYAKYAREDDDLETLERDVSEESGWKLVHGDVFRPSRNLVILSALVGTGAQLALLVLLVILLAIVGMLYVGRGAIVTTFIVCYALTSFISGYVSGGMYSRHGGKNWIKSMILTASLFPFMCFGIGFVLNTIAIFYGSLAAIPFGTMVVVFVIWAFISFPLALLGTVVGRNWSGAPNNPCRVKTIPRPIPEKKWYLTPSVVSMMGGLLPFGSIFIEMYFVFTSFWNYKVYYVYGFMLLVFLILIIVTVCVTIVGTYFLLNAENYHWQWTSFFSAASTAVYVYLYSIYYYYAKTKMSGFFQTSFYFGSCWIFGFQFVCEEDLQKYQVRLEHLREEMDLMELSRVDWPLLRYVVRDGDPATTRDRNRRVEDRESISESLNFRLQRLFYNLQLADVELLCPITLSLSLYVFGMDGKEGKGFPKRTFDSELCSDFCEF